jgi:hypothetical protein
MARAKASKFEEDRLNKVEMVENLAKIFNDNMANRQPKTSLVEVSAN